MARGKAHKKSSMGGKRGMNVNRAGERETGTKVAGRAGPAGRTATTGGSREGQFEEGSTRTRRMAAKGGRASKGSGRPRKSDI